MDDFLEIDRRNIWHPFTSLSGGHEPILIERAEGVYLHSSDGRKIIDAVSSWWVNLHGHSHPAIAQAVSEQARVLEHVIFAGFTHKPAIKLSENLLSILPENQKKIFFSDNGSTAVEVALKMAFQYWFNRGVGGRKKIIALQGAYHGDTFGSMSVGERGPFTNPFSSYLFDVEFIDFPTTENQDSVLKDFKTLVEAEDVGAFVYEPLIQAAAGMRMYSADILDSLLDVAQRHGVICIADEVFTGFGRTGKIFASDYLKNKPDIISLSKGLTGGTMALGATSCSQKIVDVFLTDDSAKTFFHGHSYTANPIACAAANASFELLIQDSSRQHLQRIEQRHLDFKKKFAAQFPTHIVRCLGTILAIELGTAQGTSYFNDLRKVILPFFLSRNILLRPLGNVIYIVPPYIISDDQLLTIYDCIEDFLKSLNPGT
jgi:adenosylmethionine-8-amino-7-oxononanoate aminotransferase